VDSSRETPLPSVGASEQFMLTERRHIGPLTPAANATGVVLAGRVAFNDSERVAGQREVGRLVDVLDLPLRPDRRLGDARPNTIRIARDSATDIRS
jgi:hypothetical protein